MLRLLLLSALFFAAFLSKADIIIQENFNGGTLPAGWINTAIQGSANWNIQMAPAFGSGSGTYYAVFDDAALGAGVTPNQAYLSTPSFDCSNRSSIYLNYQHHWYGVESTHGYVEVSTNAGVSWTTIMDYEKLTRGSLAAPQDTTFDLSAIAANQADVRVRFRYWDNSLSGQYWYIDDITIYSDPDVGVSALINPGYLGCAGSYGSAEQVTIEITNYSFLPVSNIPVNVNVSGGTTANLSGTYPGPLAPGATATYTFGSTIDMSAQALYNFEAYTSLPTDDYLLNDTLITSRQQAISTFPYLADYNLSDNGWYQSGQSPPVNGYRNFVHGPVPYLNGPQGEGNSWYVETTVSNNATFIWVESPVFNFSSLTNPQLFVDIKHSLHNSDYFHVEYSLNGGSTWTQLGSTEPNWYNTNGWWRNSTASPVDQWTQVQKSLCALAGQPCVKLRFYGRPYYSEPTYTGYHYFAFDNVEIKDGPDVGITAFIDPVNIGCLFSANQVVTVNVYNYSCTPLTNVPITCDITGAATSTLTGTVPGPIPAGTFVSYTFAGTLDMTGIGIYNFEAYTDLPGDIYLENDTLSTSIDVNQLLVNTFPYTEDFNAGPAYWIPGGTNPPLNNGRQFVLGALPYLNGPQGEGDSWYVQTTVSNQGDYIWVESPVFDFSNLTNPTLTFDIKHSLHNSDFFHVEYSLNGGTTWAQLGNGPDPLWYSTANWWQNSFSSPVGAWTTVEQDLCQLSGESCVKFRIYGRPYYSEPTYTGYHYFAFDNFSIDAGEPDDILPIEIILSDAGDCSAFGPGETVSVVVENKTCRPLYNVPIDLQLNGGAVISEIMPGPIPRFGFYIYTFTATLDMSATGTHTISVTTNLATDGNTANDNLQEVRYSNSAIAAFPYYQDFNTDNGGWVSRTTDNTRLFDLDTLSYLNGPQGEGDSWFVRTSASNNANFVWVESPVFDFTTISNPQLFMDIKHSLHNSDYFHVEYSLNGGSIWTQLGSTEPNWYNTNGWWRNSMANPVDQWTTVQKSLCALAGQACVKLRVYGRPYYSEPTYTGYHYFAFDNIEIKEGVDVGVLAFVEPLDQGCLYDTTQNVTVTVVSLGCTAITNVPITCDISGILNTSLNGTVPGPIAAGTTVNYTFPSTIDMTTLGTYDLTAYTSMPTDISTVNDTSYTSILVDQVTINTFPYYEDFNSGPAFWIPTGTNPPLNNGRQFVLGALPYLNGPEGYGDSWYVQTTVSNQADFVWVESPVFDFTGVNNPYLMFDIKHSLHNSDYFHVEYTLNGGITWIQLGNGPSSTWYNTTNWWQNSFSTPVDYWKTVEIPLCNLAGQGCVKFRIYGRPYYSEPNYTGYHYFAFDNFHITDTPIDAQVTFALGCYGSAYTMDVTVYNSDKLCLVSDTITSIDISYTIDGGSVVTQTFTGLSIGDGDSAIVSIPNVTIPSAGTSLVVWCENPNGLYDQIFQNDTAFANVSSWPNCNDFCTNATAVGIGSTTISQTSNASTSPGVDPPFPCGNPTLENTVWYYFSTDSVGGQVTVSFLNTVCTPSNNGIQVSINEISGPPCDTANYTNVFCSNEGNINDIIWGPVYLPPNTLYYITIDGDAGNDCVFDLDIQGAIIPLPAELLEFNAQCQGDVLQSWTTASEINSSYFELERMDGNQNFVSIAQVSAQGNSTISHSYIVRDQNPLEGIAYYRLKQVDFDGDYTYSATISVQCGFNGNSVDLYPNPTDKNSQLTIYSESGSEAQILIFDLEGKLLQSKITHLNNSTTSIILNGKDLEPGVYSVQVLIGDESHFKKWVIAR